jgi:hypothetical protein
MLSSSTVGTHFAALRGGKKSLEQTVNRAFSERPHLIDERGHS